MCVTARALPTLYLSSDGTTWTTVAVDNGAGDGNGALGQVTFIGSFGTFSLNVHTGTTYPAIGSLTSPLMDLSFNATSSMAGSLYIGFSANGFGPTTGAPTASVGGTDSAGDTTWYTTYGGTSNTLLDLSLVRTAQGPFTGAFSGTASGPAISNQGPYSLTQVVKITATGAGLITTGDALLSVPDASATVMLLGGGLTVLGLFGRLRRRFA